MGNLRTSLAIAVLGLAACGSKPSNKTPDAPPPQADAPKPTPDAPPDSPPAPDAPSYDFSCLGQGLPTTAPATVTVAGTAEEIVQVNSFPSIQPLNGGTLDACKTGAPNCMGGNRLATATSDTTGAYSLGPITTGGTPVDAFVHVAPANDRPTDEYPSSPIAADLSGIPIIVFSNASFTFIVGAGGITQSASNGNLGILVTDCANKPISDSANLTLTVKQNGMDVTGTTVFNAGQYYSQAAGTYFVFNVPPGATEVGATYNGMALLAHTVGVVAQTTTATQVKPGP